MNEPLARPLELPCGAVLSNRLAKAAMSEGLADFANHSTPRLENLYRRWSGSGAGLLLSGNIQVDRWHLERPNNIVIDDESGRTQLAKLAEAGKCQGGHFWAQLSHTGRKVFSNINFNPVAPSPIAVDMGAIPGVNFAVPTELSESGIAHAIKQFAFAAKAAQDAGFTGVSLHAANGYLISQFLSPLSNQRTDNWGGSLPNRARFLLEVIAAIRAAVGPKFPIGAKLNVFEYEKGGLTSAECVELAKMLNGSTLDLMELSGAIRMPKLAGGEDSEDGLRADATVRKPYALEFTGAVRAIATMPVMVTGGFRTASGMVEALEMGDLDVVGLGRPLIANPEAPKGILSGEIETLVAPDSMAPHALMNALFVLRWNCLQIERLADGLDPDFSMSGEAALGAFIELEGRNTAALLEHRGQRAA
jgi:2,4-dienoyl-CoA reductase-like NADH-dependent reductase (Old Yellow Enzyme family)